MTNDTEWLNSLKEGDQVIKSDRNGQRVGRVERLTPTMIILSSGGRFRRATGFGVGADRWSTAVLRPATDDAVKKIRRDERTHQIVIALQSAKWSYLPLEILEQVYALLPKE